MNENEDHFSEEKHTSAHHEQQPDHLSPVDARLVSELQDMYEPLAARNARSLAQVKRRLRTYQREHDQGKILSISTRKDTMQHKKDFAGKDGAKTGSIKRFVGLVTAAAIVCLLVGSMVTVLSMRNGTSGDPISSATPTNQPPETKPGPCPTTPPATEPDSAGVYITAKNGPTGMQLIKLDPATHKPHWILEIEHLQSEMVVVGNTVYVSVGEGPDVDHNFVYALNATSGELRWKTDLGDSVYEIPVPDLIPPPTGNDRAEKYNKNTYDTGVLTTPTIVDGVVYVGQRSGKYYALNATTGEKCWEYDAKTIPYSTSAHDVNSVVVHNGIAYGSLYNTYFGVDAQTGKELWRKQIADNRVFSSPRVENGKLYLSSYEARSNAGDTQSFIYAFNLQNGEQIWKYTVEEAVYTSVAVTSQTIYASGRGGTVYAVDAETGTELWTRTVEVSLHETPVVVNDVIYVSGTPHARYATERYTLKTQVFALDLVSGETIWQQGVDDSRGIGGIANGIIYLGVFPNQVAAISVDGGEPLWQEKYGETFFDKTGGESGSVPAITAVN